MLIICSNCLQQFLASNPSLTEIRSEILHYATFEQEIEDLKPTISVGPIELNTGMKTIFFGLCNVQENKLSLWGQQVIC